MASGLCSFATPVPRLRDVSDRTEPVWGFCVHTTGSTVVEQALRKGVDPLEYAVSYYLRPESYFAHYVIGYDGHLVQIADEHERAPHVGFGERTSFLDGSWEKQLPPMLVVHWRRRWPRHKSPAHLFPGTSPNNVYVGCEMIPLLQPLASGSRYTEQQEKAVARLAKDVALRWGFPFRWWETPRLVGHEDLNPISRPGWDPGVLRAVPWFRWDAVKRMIAP